MTDDKLKFAIEEFCLTKDQWNEHLSGAGSVYRLERKFADLVGKPHSIAVANATLGLWAVFEAYNIHDAEVITSQMVVLLQNRGRRVQLCRVHREANNVLVDLDQIDVDLCVRHTAEHG